MDRQRRLPGLRALRRARRDGEARRLPAGAPAVVKPTRVVNAIRALRFAHGEMTQAELARRIGVTRQTVIAIEQGRYSPSLELAFQIAEVFGTPLTEVFQYPSESEESQ
ncbi:helix-turn-helix transcriptional regulator [Kitasatospora sp. NPDC004289]